MENPSDEDATRANGICDSGQLGCEALEEQEEKPSSSRDSDSLPDTASVLCGECEMGGVRCSGGCEICSCETGGQRNCEYSGNGKHQGASRTTDSQNDCEQQDALDGVSDKSDSNSDRKEEVIDMDEVDGRFKLSKLLGCVRSKTYDNDKTPYEPFTGSFSLLPPDERHSSRALSDNRKVSNNKVTGKEKMYSQQQTEEIRTNEERVNPAEQRTAAVKKSSPQRTLGHTEPLDFSVSGTTVNSNTSVDEDRYNFSHSQRGYMIIIVNDQFIQQAPRDGAHCDLSKMREISRKFGFRQFNYGMERNLTKPETIRLLARARAMDYSDCDCFVFMISTHGLEQRNARAGGQLDHALVCADDQMIFTSYITDQFNDDNCPSLRNKPKFFIVQACRGEGLDHGSNIRVMHRQGEDKTCSFLPDDDGSRSHPRMRSFDESDTHPGADSWNRGPSTYSGASAYRSVPEHQTLYSWKQVVRETSFGPGGTSESHQYVTGSRVLREPQRGPSSFRGQGQSQAMNPVPSRPSGGVGSAELNVTRKYTDTRRAPTQTPYAIVDTPSIKCDNDMLVLYAIPPGFFAWRNNVDGSWMIHYLHQVLMQYDMRKPRNFLSVLTKVTALMSRRTTNAPNNQRLDGKKAVCVIEHRLTRDVYFEQKVPLSTWVRHPNMI